MEDFDDEFAEQEWAEHLNDEAAEQKLDQEYYEGD